MARFGVYHVRQIVVTCVSVAKIHVSCAFLERHPRGGMMRFARRRSNRLRNELEVS